MNKGGVHWLIFIVIALGVLGAIWGYKIAMKYRKQNFKDAEIKSLGYTGNPIAVIKTNMGEINFELFVKDAPETVGNLSNCPGKSFTTESDFIG